jgi:hypothetical protein
MFCPNGEWFDKNKQDTPIWMSSHFSEVYVDKFNLV